MGGARRALGCLALAAAAAAAQSELTLRDGSAPPEGRVASCSIEGVVVASPVTGELIVGWERVRTVSGEHGAEAGAFGGVSDQAWRALARLERGDIPAAEPLLEGLFMTFADRTGPTAAAVSGGLLRCRIDRGAHTLAVGAWLSWLHATGADRRRWFDPDASATVGAVDGATGLLPELPPIWLDLSSVRVFGDAPAAGASFGGREQALAELYRHAARARSGGREPMPRLTSPDPGVHLVWDIVAAQSAITQERAAGRRAVEVRLRAEPAGWVDAWLRTALGRSLLLEPEAEQRQRGVIELLRVRVAHERDCPYLAGLSLADAAVAMRSLGDADAGGMLRRELLDRFPGHPAAGTEAIMLWDSPQPVGVLPSGPTIPPAGAGQFSEESRKLHG
jgi:hypothetical protein